MSVSIESLKKTHGEKAPEIFNQIANIGGFGNVPVNYPGGLDVHGMEDGEKKDRILALLEKPKKDGK